MLSAKSVSERSADWSCCFALGGTWSPQQQIGMAGRCKHVKPVLLVVCQAPAVAAQGQLLLGNEQMTNMDIAESLTVHTCRGTVFPPFTVSHCKTSLLLSVQLSSQSDDTRGHHG